MTALVSLKVAIIRHFRGKKKPSKINTQIKAKTGLNYQSNLCFSHAFEIFISCLTLSFGEVAPHISLNVAINRPLTSRNTLKISIFGLLFESKKG